MNTIPSDDSECATPPTLLLPELAITAPPRPRSGSSSRPTRYFKLKLFHRLFFVLFLSHTTNHLLFIPSET